MPAKGKEEGEGRGIEMREKEKAIVSGAHTGVGLDSFIGRATPHGARGREEGSGTGEGVKDGTGEGEKGTGDTHTYKRRRKREPCVAQFGTNGKNETHRESVRNQFAMHYAIRGTRVCLPRQTGI